MSMVDMVDIRGQPSVIWEDRVPVYLRERRKKEKEKISACKEKIQRSLLWPSPMVVL